MALRRGVLLVTLVPVLLGGGAVAAPAGQTGPVRLPYFGDDAFAGVWTRTDALVADATVARSWVWGPQQISGPLEERYDGLPGGKHLVQYFDKSRMEINDPGADRNTSWYVTNGLLTVELISGRMRTGLAPNAYEDRGPAQIPVAGDTDDPNAPTYASFRGVSSTSGDNEHPAPDRTGADVTAVINRVGQVSDDPARALPATRMAAYVPEFGPQRARRLLGHAARLRARHARRRHGHRAALGSLVLRHRLADQ